MKAHDAPFPVYFFLMKGYLYKYSADALPLDELILKVNDNFRSR